MVFGRMAQAFSLWRRSAEDDRLPTGALLLPPQEQMAWLGHFGTAGQQRTKTPDEPQQETKETATDDTSDTSNSR